MKYFVIKKIITEDTTLSIVTQGEPAVKFTYGDRELWGVITDDTAAFLSMQHPECEVQERTYSEVETQLKKSHVYRDVGAIKQKELRRRYSQADESRIKRLLANDPERQNYEGYLERIRLLEERLRRMGAE